MSGMDYGDFKARLESKFGFDLGGYKENFVARRLESRMGARGAKSMDAYWRMLSEEPGEYRAFLESISINVSEFFRDPASCNALWGVLEEIFSRKAEKKQKFVRIWSAGCSEGEEPYTLSIMVHELLGDMMKDFSVAIIATDIDASALESAEQGTYFPQRVKNAGTRFLSKYFVPVGKKYTVKNSVKSLVRFARGDLMQPALQQNFDLVCCRNVLIYLEREKQAAVFESLAASLNIGGYLFLGSTEALPPNIAGRFRTVDAAARIYQKKE